MKNKTTYTNEPIGKIEIVKDFLPSPERLVHRKKKIRVTGKSKRTSSYFGRI